MNRKSKFPYAATFLALLALPAGAQISGNWTRQIPNTFPPPGGTLYFDTAHNDTRLYRGANEFWLWDGANWKQQLVSNSPQPDRTSYAMAYDSRRGQLVLFGGIVGLDAIGDTWIFDGATWIQKFPQNSPSPRFASGLAYDSARGQTVLFAGLDANHLQLNETWVWDGNNWTRMFPQTSPPVRSNFTMAYDSARSQIVMFGGSSNPTFLGDTWVWDGAKWTQKFPAVTPPARAGMALAFDAAHSQTLLFGGVDLKFSLLGDSWTWDGGNWTQQFPQTSPSARNNSAMAFDSAHGQILLFAGSSFQDTWTWVGAGSGGTQPSIAAVINASGFGGSTTVAPGSWVEIYGSALASSTRSWGGADFTGNNAPTSLDGVQVTIGGQKAFVDYISSNPGQINAQLPSNIATGGSLPLTVTNGTVTSAAFTVPVQPTSAALEAPASFQIGGKQYLVALLPDGVTFILPPGAIPGVPARRAKPGETIITYGIGFGSVKEGIPAGQIATQASDLSLPLQILFGQTPAQVQYKGLSPGYVGLYQFNIVVPSVPDNDLVPVTFNLGGVPSTQTLYIAVHQ